MISIEELANDTAAATARYRGHEVEFIFKPGRYTGELLHSGNVPLVDILAACVTEWNITGCDPTDASAMRKLPQGLILAVFRELDREASLADLPEVPAISPTG